MPRAIEQAEKIIEQLAIMRESIHSLNEQLKQVSILCRQATCTVIVNLF